MHLSTESNKLHKVEYQRNLMENTRDKLLLRKDRKSQKEHTINDDGSLIGESKIQRRSDKQA